jgi:hypothetical protein
MGNMAEDNLACESSASTEASSKSSKSSKTRRNYSLIAVGKFLGFPTSWHATAGGQTPTCKTESSPGQNQRELFILTTKEEEKDRAPAPAEGSICPAKVSGETIPQCNPTILLRQWMLLQFLLTQPLTLFFSYFSCKNLEQQRRRWPPLWSARPTWRHSQRGGPPYWSRSWSRSAMCRMPGLIAGNPAWVDHVVS